MKVRNQFYRLMAEADDAAGGGGAATGGTDTIAGGADTVAGGADTVAGGQDTVTGGADTVTGGDTIAATWPEDWRSKIAGADEKTLAKLNRYQSPEDVAKALLQLQQKISAGELRAQLPKNATEDQIKLWREQNGIPESPDKYELKLDNGLVVGEDDKELVGRLLEGVHKVGGNSQTASQVVNLYYQEVERAEAARHESDRAAAQAASDALHQEWGAEFRPNMNMIENLLNSAPGGIGDSIKYGRLSDGTPIMSNPDAIRWLNGLAREINPVTTLLPNSHGGSLADSIDSEIANIEKTMRTDRKAYNADEKMQARLRDLYSAREKAKQKGG